MLQKLRTLGWGVVFVLGAYSLGKETNGLIKKFKK